MIDSTEIEAKAEELGVHVANVQRDYVFGWLLAGLFRPEGEVRPLLALKGGNSFRKAYFQNARFSNDLDFSAQVEVDPDQLKRSLMRAGEFAADMTGIQFLVPDTRVTHTRSAAGESSRYEARVYFKSFYLEDNATIKVELDVKEFEKVILPLQARQLIHDYSDHEACSATLRCHQLEESLAAKLKALIQRQHSPDLYDFVHAIFFQRALAVNRRQIITTFLKKTIYEPNPAVARGLLLDLPFQVIRGLWREYLVCPQEAVIDFDRAEEWFRAGIDELFSLLAPAAQPVPAYAGPAISTYASSDRNTILEAGRLRRLLRLSYKGVTRLVEPYSLVFKRRLDGVAREYFYVWDRTGGTSSGPGLKSFFTEDVHSVRLTEETFEPQYPIELTKAASGYFAQPFSDRPAIKKRPRRRRRASTSTYTIQCPYCDKKFKRSTTDTRLRDHKDKYGNKCYGRTGFVVW